MILDEVSVQGSERTLLVATRLIIGEMMSRSRTSGVQKP